MPLGKLVQSACFAHQFMARTKVQMIGIGKHDSGTYFLQVSGRHCLDGRLRSDTHETRSINNAVRRVQLAETCAGAAVCFYKFISYGLVH